MSIENLNGLKIPLDTKFRGIIPDLELKILSEEEFFEKTEHDII